jgi:hypothetical protein
MTDYPYEEERTQEMNDVAREDSIATRREIEEGVEAEDSVGDLMSADLRNIADGMERLKGLMQ